MNLIELIGVFFSFFCFKGPVALELLTLSLDLVKNRVVVMGVDMRKLFIGGILVGLIEKSTDVKVSFFDFSRKLILIKIFFHRL